MKRVLTASVAASILGAVVPATSSAGHWLSFQQVGGGEPSYVQGEPADPFKTLGPERVEVLRNGVAVGEPTRPVDWGAGVQLQQLQPGDHARYYHGETLVIERTYDGLPAISGACAGAWSFRATMGDLVPMWVTADSADGSNMVTQSSEDPTWWTLARPLRVGDTVRATGFRMLNGSFTKLDGGFQLRGDNVQQTATLKAIDCSPPAPKGPESTPQPTKTTSPALKLRAHRTRRGLSVEVGFPRAGTVRLRVMAGTRTLSTARRQGSTSRRIALNLDRRQRDRRLTVKATLLAAGDQAKTSATLVLARRTR